MKKILFAFGALALMAAGCSQSVSNNSTSNNSTASMGTDNSAGSGAGMQTQSSVKVNSVDDAINSLESNSAATQSKVSGTDDTDILNSDSTTINSMTGDANAQ